MPKLIEDISKRAKVKKTIKEFDKVRLIKPITVEGHSLEVSKEGIVLECHGDKGYEVEFPDIQWVFGIPAEYLEKI